MTTQRSLSTIFAIIACISLSISSINVLALGLGKLTTESHLSEPLKAHIPIRISGSENLDDVRVTLASREIYEKMGLEFTFLHNKVKLTIDQSDATQPNILISTTAPFNNPFIELIVTVKTPTQQFNRSFTLLLDAPNNDNAPSVFTEE